MIQYTGRGVILVGESRIESYEEVSAYLAKLKLALGNGAIINFQNERSVDANRNVKYTNKFTMSDLFPDEDPNTVLKRELQTLTVANYIKTVRDTRFPTRSEMREFGKTYTGEAEVYIKVRVELLNVACGGNHTVFVMSFHYAQTPFSEERFPYA